MGLEWESEVLGLGRGSAVVRESIIAKKRMRMMTKTGNFLRCS